VHGYDKEEEARMELLTLGERRSRSKSNVKDSIDRLLSDPDPIVITNILNNPRVTEREVLKVASKRPNSPGILKLVATHRVWSKRYAVKKAVASNPYSSPRVDCAPGAAPYPGSKSNSRRRQRASAGQALSR
jgi:hypothetical protein